MRRARGAHDVVDRAPRGSRARRTRACRRRAACASSCDPAPATRAPRPACPAAAATSRRPVARRGDLYASAMSLPGLPWTIAEAARRFADRTAYVTPLGWSLSYADVDRISDEVAVGLARAASAPATSSALVLPPGPEYLLTYAAAAKLGAITAGVNDRLSERERDAILERRRARGSSSPTDDAPAAPTRVDGVLDALRVAGEAPPAARRRSRPPGRDHLHVGHDGLAEGRALLQPPARVHHRRPTSATRGTAAAARSAARRSRTSAS